MRIDTNANKQSIDNNHLGKAHVVWAILLIALAFAAFVRCRLASFPLERDEGEYAYAGQLLLQGVPPYKLAYNMKLPGTYLAYAAIMAVFGESTVGIHLGLTVVNLATIVLLFFLTRDLFDALAGAVAAACYAVLSVSPCVLGMAGHATHFVALFSVAGAWVLWRAMQSGRWWSFAAAGLLFGLAFLMKQQAVFLLGFGGLAALAHCATRRPIVSWRNLVALAAFAVGAAIPLAAYCAWFWWVETFGAFWFWTFEYARTYVTRIPMSRAVERFSSRVQEVVDANWPIWALALAGIAGLALRRGVPLRRTFVVAYLAFSFLCVTPGLYFRCHYFIVLLPSVAMLAGVGSVMLVQLASRLFSPPAATAKRPEQRGRHNRRPIEAPEVAPKPVARYVVLAAAMAVSLLCVLRPVWQQRAVFFVWTPVEACRNVYVENPFVECTVIADYLRRHSSPDDRIAVIGSEPEIYFYTKRISATGYIYVYPLMELQPFALRMQKEMIAEIEAAEPEYVVMGNLPSTWLMIQNSERHILNWARRYLADRYQTVGLIDLRSPQLTEYKWDTEAMTAQPQAKYYFWVYRKRSGGVPAG